MDVLKDKESYKIEFKENLNSLDKEFTAFANASGGKIFLGVTDRGEIKGIDISNSLKSRIQDIANNCRPKISITMEETDNILIIKVKEGDDKPYECASGYYKRIGPNSQKMTRDELLDFFKTENKVKFDKLTEPKFNYPEDFDKERFLKFLQLAEISEVDDIDKLLINLNVAEKYKKNLIFNNAGILFFAKEPQRFISWSVFTVALLKDDSGVDIIDRKDIDGGLFEIVEEVMNFVKLYSKVAYRFKGELKRENIYEYPFDALREAIINSVMHKYYFENGHNNILRFFPDKIRIENYWQKPPHFVLGKTVFRRNQIIADLFSKIHFGEKMGTGFERIKEICQKENSPFPEIEFNENYFYITFRQSKEYIEMTEKEKIREDLFLQLNERQKKALITIKEKNRITMKEYIEMYPNMNRKTLTRDINHLIKLGLVIRKGKGRRDLYYLLA
ncbi:MAG: hypothetical protein FJW61_04645 [Actinobacteria bacterium]|nr:hypothetical protein [Actinomycetota bacterium]